MVLRAQSLEMLNRDCLRLYDQLGRDYAKVLIAAGPKPKRLFSFTNNLVVDSKNGNGTQEDLNELAQLYSALNSADISALYFLKKHCQAGGLFDPTSDPNLCEEYPKILAKQVQNRLGVINSWVMHSEPGIVVSPPGWLYHAVTASELMRDIDRNNLLEYKAQEGVIRAVAERDSDEFDKMPNIYNEGLLDTTAKGSVQPQKAQKQAQVIQGQPQSPQVQPQIIQVQSRLVPPKPQIVREQPQIFQSQARVQEPNPSSSPPQQIQAPQAKVFPHTEPLLQNMRQNQQSSPPPYQVAQSHDGNNQAEPLPQFPLEPDNVNKSNPPVDTNLQQSTDNILSINLKL